MNNKSIVPVGSRCLIQPYVSADKTESGLYLDNQSNTSAAPVLGTVLVAGDASVFKAGDNLYFRRYSVDILKIITEKGEEVVTLVEDADVVAREITS